jgi:26S proteasome regulatory subunit N10
VLFGDMDDSETERKLRAFNDEVKNGDSSNFVTIPPSGKLLSDQLIATPILLGENAAAGTGGFGGAGGAGGGAGGGNGEFGEFGFDEAGIDDPELALALRMSMEEEKARQEKKAREEAEAAKKASLETVKEGDEAAEPLLDEAGQPSGEGRGSKEDDQNGKPDGGDKMDTS